MMRAQQTCKETPNKSQSEAAIMCKAATPTLSSTDLPLEQLLGVCLETGEETLWTEFVRRSQPLIAGVVAKTIRRWVKPSRTIVDDLVQETYLKLCLNNFKALRRFIPQHENALYGFLRVVTSNAVQDHF